MHHLPGFAQRTWNAKVQTHGLSFAKNVAGRDRAHGDNAATHDIVDLAVLRNLSCTQHFKFETPTRALIQLLRQCAKTIVERA